MFLVPEHGLGFKGSKSQFWIKIWCFCWLSLGLQLRSWNLMHICDDLMFFVSSLGSTMLGIGNVVLRTKNSEFRGLKGQIWVLVVVIQFLEFFQILGSCSLHELYLSLLFLELFWVNSWHIHVSLSSLANHLRLKHINNMYSCI